MGKIYTVDFNIDIIDFLADSLLKQGKENNLDFSSLAVVTPGRRPQFYLRKTLAKRINKAFLPPRIFSIQEFIQYLAKKIAQPNRPPGSTQPVSLTDACFLIYKSIQGLKLTYLDWQKQLEFKHFFLWARRIYQFLEELDKELISERQLLDLEENAQIGLPLPDYINQLLENINQIHRGFHRCLEENNLTTPGFNYYKVAQAIDKISLDEFKQIYFAGFFALTACERKIVKHFLEQDLAILLWQKDKDKWSIFEELEDFFAVSPQRVELPDYRLARNRNSRPRIQIYEGFDTHSQIEAAREILLRVKDLSQTCIVLPQPDSLIPLLYQGLPADLSEYNISLGYPLKRTPIYALINMIIQFQERKRQDGSFYAKDYLKVIMHPYIKNIADDKITPEMNRILIHKIEEALLGIDQTAGLEKKAFIKLEEVEENALIFQVASQIINASKDTQIESGILQNHLRLIHKSFLNAFEGCLTVLDFVRATQEMLYFIFKKSSVFSDVFSGEVFNRFLAILDNLGNSLFKQEAMRDKSGFFELLKINLSFEKIPFSGTPVKGLQILGLLETRNLKFKNLIFLDVNEGVLPKAEKGESLVPEGVFSILGLPHYHKREEIMRYHFRRLLGAAENAFLIYQTCSKDKESRSRFVEEIIWQEEKRSRKLYAREKIKQVAFRVTPTKQGFCLIKSPQTLGILKNNVFSPTSLDTYLHCPAQFYFRYCLGLREKEQIAEGLEASDIGNFLHSLLRDFYALFLNKTVKLDEAAKEYLFELKQKKFKEFFPEQTGERFLLSRIVDYRLRFFLDQEAARRERIKILYLEQELPIEPAKIKLETQCGPVYLKGKLDRVDERFVEGKRRIVILDYKSGAYNLPKKTINQDSLSHRRKIKRVIGSFQLPIYIYLFSQSKKISPSEVQAGFYSLRQIKEEFLFADNQPEELYKIYLTAAGRILSEILSADSDFVRDDSDEYYCRWCPFPALCKR